MSMARLVVGLCGRVRGAHVVTAWGEVGVELHG
jgi:hypothetical protein